MITAGILIILLASLLARDGGDFKLLGQIYSTTI